MGKIKFEIKENSFSKKYSDTYNLSILLGVDRLSFLVSDSQQKALLLRHYELSANFGTLSQTKEVLKSLYINDEILKLSFKKTTVGVVNKKNTFIPEDLFDVEEKEIYLKNMVSHPKSDTILFDKIKPMGIVNLYAVNTDLVNQLSGYFPNTVIKNVASTLIEGYRENAKNYTGRQVYINVGVQNLQIALFDNKELLFFNDFHYQSSRDFVYYVMLIFDQFNLDPEGNTVHITGHIVQDSEIYHLLFRYVRHLDIINSNDLYVLDKKMEQMNTHFYFDLFTLKLCE